MSILAAQREALETNSCDFELLFKSLAGLCLILKPDGRDFIVIFSSREYEKYADVSSLIGRSVFESFPENPDNALESGPAGMRASLERAVRSGKPDELEAHRYDVKKSAEHGDGFEEKFWSIVNTPIFDKSGKLTYILHQAQDKTQEIRIKNQQDRYFGVVTDLLILASFEGRFIKVSPAWEKTFGWTSEEMAARPWLDFVHPDDVQATIDIASQLFNGQTIVQFENRYRCKDGTYRWLLWKAQPDMQEKTIYCAASDVTQIKGLQLESKIAQGNAEAANIAKTEFLANMSHEIRTPMNAIIGLSNILAMSHPLTIKQREFIKTLQSSSDTLLVLINDLLDIAKIEARTVELEHIPFTFGMLTQEIASMMAVQVRRKGLTFTGEGGDIQGRVYLGDPSRIRQVITNLCSNAVKFTDKGGIVINVSGERAKQGSFETVCIAVTDTGIGIAAENLDSIFNKFVQADASINRKYGGTGLGLTITKTLVELMGGRISLKSAYGLGSTFEVRLPLEIADDQSLAVQQGKPSINLEKLANKPKANILLVEDYSPNVLVASTFLESFGYNVDVASNGQDAVDMLKTGQYPVALMDVQMHGMNGLDATADIRKYEKAEGKKPVHIIGMTAHALAGDRDRCLGAGMNDYMAKPFNPDDLREKILTALVLRK